MSGKMITLLVKRDYFSEITVVLTVLDTLYLLKNSFIATNERPSEVVNSNDFKKRPYRTLFLQIVKES